MASKSTWTRCLQNVLGQLLLAAMYSGLMRTLLLSPL